MYSWGYASLGLTIKCVHYREFETADLIGFPLLDSIQSNNLSLEPLNHRAPGPTVQEGQGALGTRMIPVLNVLVPGPSGNTNIVY